MYGAVIGDIIGSIYEVHNVNTTEFELFPQGSKFTDDTVLSVAVADKILNQDNSAMSSRKSYALWYKQYYRRYPNAGFGQMFAEWARSDMLSVQKSYGNGAAMRVSAIGYAYDSPKEIVAEVKKSCYYTHNNREAIIGACAIALAVFYARKGYDKDMLKREIVKQSHYKLDFSLDEIRDDYEFNSRTAYSVPPAIVAFLESESYEEAIRKAISIGGDSDTIACMAGGIAQAYYKKIPEHIMSKGKMILDMGLKNVIEQFNEKYKVEY